MAKSAQVAAVTWHAKARRLGSERALLRCYSGRPEGPGRNPEACALNATMDSVLPYFCTVREFRWLGAQDSQSGIEVVEVSPQASHSQWCLISPPSTNSEWTGATIQSLQLGQRVGAENGRGVANFSAQQ